MDFNDAEIFLELVRTRNVSKAAEHLYLAQSTVSNRLQKLETELGFQLIIRGKGKGAIELTHRGAEFIPIAKKWKTLHDEMNMLKNASMIKLRIATNESTYLMFLNSYIQEFSKENQDVAFNIRIYDSQQVYEHIDKNQADLGFVSYLADYPGIITESLMTQELVIVAHGDSSSDSFMNPAALDPLKEVCFSGGNFVSINRWKEKWIDKNTEARFSFNNIQCSVSTLKQPGFWAILPRKVAEYIANLAEMKVYRLKEPIDLWNIYLIRNKYCDQDKADILHSFMAGFYDYLSQYKTGEKDFL